MPYKLESRLYLHNAASAGSPVWLKYNSVIFMVVGYLWKFKSKVNTGMNIAYVYVVMTFILHSTVCFCVSQCKLCVCIFDSD